MSQTQSQQEETIEAIKAVLIEKYPYILDILDEVKKCPNGIVSLQLRVYNGVVTDIVGTDTWRKNYKPQKS